jgi:DoxX
VSRMTPKSASSRWRIDHGNSLQSAASKMTTDRLEAWTPRALSILRIMTGVLFLQHGTQGFPPSEHAFPPLFSLMGLQGVIELVGGFLILIGLFTRPLPSSSRVTWP